MNTNIMEDKEENKCKKCGGRLDLPISEREACRCNSIPVAGTQPLPVD
ncbi:hypothetical protein ACFLZ7_03030 [Nanoarchaeota archaeon]